MLGLLIFGFIVVFAQKIVSEWPAISEVLEQTQILRRGGMTSPNLRTVRMEDELGRRWGPWDPESDPDMEFDRPTLRSYSLRRYFGPMDMDIAGDQVLIYDMLLGSVFTIDDPNQLSEQIFQTVISIKPPELRLPPFILRPMNVFEEQFSTVKTVKTDTALDVLFTMETLAPHRVKALFQSDFGSSVLVPFLTDHRWTVEWTGDCLIVYEFNRLIEPGQLAEVALEVSEFFELLKSGPEVIDRGMKEFIRQAAPNL